MDKTATIYFDNNCFLCRQLAAFGSKTCAARFVPWQNLSETEQKQLDPENWDSYDTLRFLNGGTLHIDDAAWTQIIDLYPLMKKSQWIATGMGISSGNSLNKVAKWARRMCIKCGR